MNVDLGHHEALVGFDARHVGECCAALWDSERRRSFLLVEVAQPLSADLRVWPSVFEPVVPAPGSRTTPPQPLPRPEWIGPNAPLWENLEKLTDCIAAADSSARPPLWIIAVTWREFASTARGLGGPYLEPPSPAARDPAWELLGYDVTDGSISGLSNCGCETVELNRARAQWAPKLNEHHLFRQVDDALAFAQSSNARVPEHAPFGVAGLWCVSRSHAMNRTEHAE